MIRLRQMALMALNEKRNETGFERQPDIRSRWLLHR